MLLSCGVRLTAPADRFCQAACDSKQKLALRASRRLWISDAVPALVGTISQGFLALKASAWRPGVM
jgi:hypothetical protein